MTQQDEVTIALADKELKFRGMGVGSADARPFKNIAVYLVEDEEGSVLRLAYPGTRRGSQAVGLLGHLTEGSDGVLDLSQYRQGIDPSLFGEDSAIAADEIDRGDFLHTVLTTYWHERPSDPEAVTAMEFSPDHYLRVPVNPDFAALSGEDDPFLDMVVLRLTNPGPGPVLVGEREREAGEETGLVVVEAVHKDGVYAKKGGAYVLALDLSSTVRGGLDAQHKKGGAVVEVQESVTSAAKTAAFERLKLEREGVVSPGKPRRVTVSPSESYADLATYDGEIPVEVIRKRLLDESLIGNTVQETWDNISRRVVDAGIFESTQDVALLALDTQSDLDNPLYRIVSEGRAGIDELLGTALERGDTIRAAELHPSGYDRGSRAHGVKDLIHAQVYLDQGNGSALAIWKATTLRQSLGFMAYDAMTGGSAANLLEFGAITEEHVKKGKTYLGEQGNEDYALDLVDLIPGYRSLSQEERTHLVGQPLFAFFNEIDAALEQGETNDALGQQGSFETVLVQIPRFNEERGVFAPGWMLYAESANPEHAIWEGAGEVHLAQVAAELLMETERRAQQDHPLAHAYDQSSGFYLTSKVGKADLEFLKDAAEGSGKKLAVLQGFNDGMLTGREFPSKRAGMGQGDSLEYTCTRNMVNMTEARVERAAIALELGLIDRATYLSNDPRKIEEALAANADKGMIITLLDDKAGSTAQYDQRRHLLLFEPDETYARGTLGKDPLHRELGAIARRMHKAVGAMQGFGITNPSSSQMGFVLTGDGDRLIRYWQDLRTQIGNFRSAYNALGHGSSGDQLREHRSGVYWAGNPNGIDNVVDGTKKSEYTYKKGESAVDILKRRMTTRL